VRRLGGNAGHLLELDWEGTIRWQYEHEAIHHDFVRLENGNTLVAEWVEIPPDLAARVKGGARRPRERFPPLLSDDIVEIDQAGAEVGRIHLWELLDPAKDPICPIETRWEWTHTNSLALAADGGVIFSCRQNSRVGIIDRASGDLRWKWGAPHVHHQHHATATPDGRIQVFDNGTHRVGGPGRAL
jgi:outer membrane protein assembly factor BamB